MRNVTVFRRPKLAKISVIKSGKNRTLMGVVDYISWTLISVLGSTNLQPLSPALDLTTLQEIRKKRGRDFKMLNF